MNGANVTRSFLLQVPLIVAGLLNILISFDNDCSTKEEGWTRKVKRIDFGGAFLIIFAVSTLLVGVEQASRDGWESSLTIGCIVSSFTLFAAFFFVEMKLAVEPFAPKHVLFARTIGSCIACSFFTYGCWISILYQLPLYWQAVEGKSPSVTAVRLLPGFVAGVMGSMSAGFVCSQVL